MAEVRTIAVLGAGDMGHGIAELAAMKGFDVRLRDISQDVLDRANAAMKKSLDKLVEKQRLTRDAADAAFARIRTTTDLGEAVGQADFVIEAVPENLSLKQKVFAEVESAAPASCVFASNTSAMRIREIGETMKDASRLVGMHFFNPVMLMDLIEIIPGPASSPDAVRAVEEVSKKLGKTTVTLQKDTPGFVTSRLIGVWVGAGILAHDAKLASKESIDAAMRNRAGFPMGPFELADYTGLDIGAHASGYIADRLGDAYRVSPTMQSLVDKGMLGKKTGRGFYEWSNNRVANAITQDAAKDFDPAIIMSVVANEATKLLDQGVATAAEIDLAMRHGCAFPKGPLEWADEHGLDNVLKTLYTLEEKTGNPIARPYETLVELVEAGKLGKKSGEGFYTHAAAADAASHGAEGAGTPAYETLLVEVDAETKVGTIKLNRPHRLHALNDELFRELRRAFAQMEEDENVRAVLLTATGDKAFCVGADLSDASDVTPAKMTDLARFGHRMCLDMEKMGKPIVAGINGYAFGGGLELTLPCDFRVAARHAKVALPEVTLGLLPAMGGTQRLPKLIGLSRAKEFALLGNRIDADTAFQWGLIHRLFDSESFEADAKAFTAEVASRAPIAQRYIKQLLNMAPTTDIAAGMEAESLGFGVLASTEDMGEGVMAMFSKRKPEFQGR